MNHAPNDNLHAASDADLVRLYVDGELTGEARQAFEGRLAGEPSLRARVDAERRMKERIVELMQDAAPAPAGLAERISAAMDEVTDPSELGPPVAGVIGPSDEPERADAEPAANDGRRRSWLIGPARANIFAVAASLLIVGAVVIVGIYGPTIDDFAGRGSTQAPPDLEFAAAQWVNEQHNECATSREYVTRKFDMPAAALHGELARYLGVPDIVEFDLTSMGYEFVGAGACRVPGASTSAHLLFARAGGPFPAMFSIFLVPDEGQYHIGSTGRMPVGEWHTVIEGTSTTKAVYALSDGELVYFITACDSSDYVGLGELMLNQLKGAP